MKSNNVNLKEDIQSVSTFHKSYEIGDNVNGVEVSSIKPYFACDGKPILYMLCDKDENVILGIQCVTEIEFN